MIADLHHAPLAILAFLAACLAVVSAVTFAAFSLMRGRRKRARRVLVALAVVLGGYSAVLLGFSVFSHERVLGHGVEKYYCEVDCHLAYAVTQVDTHKQFGGRRATGVFYRVTLRTRFDENTISSRRRKDATLVPNPRKTYVEDARGTLYPQDTEATALANREGKTRPLTAPLRPGESYLTLFVFDLPEDVERPRMMLSNGSWANTFLIGHENSPGHNKAYFSLEPVRSNAGGMR